MPSAAEWKSQGNAAFSSKQWKKATMCFTNALKQLPKDDTEGAGTILSNRCAAWMQLGEFGKGAFLFLVFSSSLS
jgi:hypothetical protein